MGPTDIKQELDRASPTAEMRQGQSTDERLCWHCNGQANVATAIVSHVLLPRDHVTSHPAPTK